MNESEQVEYAKQFKPGKQLIKVYKVVQHGDKLSKIELFIGFLADVSDRGLYLIPLNDYGSSVDKLASSFFAYSQFRSDGIYEYKVFKSV